MNDGTLPTLIGVVRKHAQPVPLRCRCGGQVTLAGKPAPTYTCGACGTATHDLMDLVPAPAPSPGSRLRERTPR